MKIKLLFILLGFILGIFIFIGNSLGATFAHSGRTDSSGCHNCYTSECYGEYHCHNGGYDGSDENYTPPKCTYNGTTYNSSTTASQEAKNTLNNVVDKLYLRMLEREATYKDYNEWYEKYNFDFQHIIDCNWSGFNEQDIINDISNSEEYKHIQWLKAHKINIRDAYILILGRGASNEEIDYWAEKEDDINVIKEELKKSDEYKIKNDWFGFYTNKYKWWLLVITGILFYYSIAYYIENRKK